MAGSFSKTSNVAVTARASINKKGANVFIKSILKKENLLFKAISRSD